MAALERAARRAARRRSRECAATARGKWRQRPGPVASRPRPTRSSRARRLPQFDNLSWGRRAHLTVSPNLWNELASLRGENGAQPVGPWLERRRCGATSTQRERSFGRRLAMMERALTSSG